MDHLTGSFFQCYPASGSFTRSGLNLEAGATSPIAAVFAALFLIGLVAAFQPLVGRVPIAAVAGSVLYVAYKLLDFSEIGRLLRKSRTESAIATITFVVGLLVNLQFASQPCAWATPAAKSSTKSPWAISVRSASPFANKGSEEV